MKKITYFSFVLLMQYSFILCNQDKKNTNLLNGTCEAAQFFPLNNLKNNSGNRILYELNNPLYKTGNEASLDNFALKDNGNLLGKDHVLSENYRSSSINGKNERNVLGNSVPVPIQKNGEVNYKAYFDNHQVNECKQKEKTEIHTWVCDEKKKNCAPSRRINLCTNRLEIIPDTIEITDYEMKESLMDYFKKFIYGDAASEGKLLLNKYDDKNNNEYCNDMVNSFGDYKNIVEGTGLTNVANANLLELKIQNIFGSDDNAKRDRKIWWKNHENIIWKAMVLGKDFNETSNYENICTNYKIEDHHSQIERWAREWIQEFSVQYFKEANKINNKCIKKSNIFTESICTDNDCKTACNAYETWINTNKSKWNTLLQSFANFKNDYFNEETCKDKAYNSLMIEFKEAYEVNFENVINLDDDHYRGLCVCSSTKANNTVIDDSSSSDHAIESPKSTDEPQNHLLPPSSTDTVHDLFKEDDDDGEELNLLSYHNTDSQDPSNIIPTEQITVNKEQSTLNQSAESDTQYKLQIMDDHVNSDNTYHKIKTSPQENNIQNIAPSIPEPVIINPTPVVVNKGVKEHEFNTNVLENRDTKDEKMKFFPIPPKNDIKNDLKNVPKYDPKYDPKIVPINVPINVPKNDPKIVPKNVPKNDNILSEDVGISNNDINSEHVKKLEIYEYEHRDIKKTRDSIITLATANVCNNNPALEYCKSINNKYSHGVCPKNKTQNLCCSISNYCIKFFNINSKKYYDCMNKEFMDPSYECFQKASYSNQYYYATGGIIIILILLFASVGYFGNNRSEEETFTNYEEYLFKSYNQTTLNNGFKHVQEYIPVDFY
ncbi:duffy-binding protein [Plasmodium vinckei brucechwatti]|uniref:Duffy-binding protein n=1 Tax=Plasmodium vinckei brucechwatti TaxID=119398 RepID=A0A6V7SQD7_PLAVN|nr:duffy-binding protein [Plasmodium vinckei brucechwatti]